MKQSKPDLRTKAVLTREEAARYLNVSLPTLWAWNKRSILPAHKIEGKVFYKMSDILKALKPA
ncbi:MAG: helix-turn-helix domain-containing protein [Chitinophagales bacterium]